MKTIKKTGKKWRQTQSTELRTDGTKKLSLKGEQVHQENCLKRWLGDRNWWTGKWEGGIKTMLKETGKAK